jgi:phospholipid/cholesterol/gamma-HCH transport system substrate-binding protein
VGDQVPFRIRLLAGLTGTVMLLGIMTFVIQYSNGALAGGYTITAVFDRAGQGLYTGNDVKIRGVTVGTIKSTKLRADGRVDISLLINSGVHIADTSSASIDPLSVFGPKFVNVTPGAHETSGPFLNAGGVISNTVPATELLDVLNHTYHLLTAIDPNDLATVVQTLGQALDGLGPDIAQTVDSLHTIAAAARAETPNLSALLTQLNRLTAALAPHGSTVVALATDLNQVLPSINAHPDEVAALLDNVGQVADDLAGVLEAHAPAVNELVNGLTVAANGLYVRRQDLAPLVGTLSQFFALLGGIIRSPGEAVPNGKVPGNIVAYAPSNLCTLLVGVCPGS